MINITKGNKNKTIINRDNKNIEIYTLNNSIYLSKKNIAIFFDTKKSQIKSIINKENINYYDSKKGKNIKLYNLESIIMLGYKLKKSEKSRDIINIKRRLNKKDETNLIKYTKSIINFLNKKNLI